MSVFKLGVVGTGVGGEFVVKAAKMLEEEGVLKVTAICGKRPEKTKSFAQKWGIPNYYTDHLEMFRKAELDAVAISTPHYLHFPIAVDAIDAGLHVLVDKPMAINLVEADEMINRARRAGVKLGVILQSRFDEKLRKIKRLVEEGRLGRLLMGEAVVEWFRTQEYYDKSPWRGRWATEGGGALINQAIHTIDLLIWIMGDVESLWALVGTMAHDIEVEDLAVAALRFKNGAFGLIQGSTAIYPGLPTRLEIHGEKGTVIHEGGLIKMIAIEGEETYSEKEVVEGLAAWARPEAVPPINHRELIRDFIDAVKEDREPYVSGIEGRKSLEVIRAIYWSGRTGKVAKFPFLEYVE